MGWPQTTPTSTGWPGTGAEPLPPCGPQPLHHRERGHRLSPGGQRCRVCYGELSHPVRRLRAGRAGPRYDNETGSPALLYTAPDATADAVQPDRRWPYLFLLEESACAGCESPYEVHVKSIDPASGQSEDMHEIGSYSISHTPGLLKVDDSYVYWLKDKVWGISIEGGPYTIAENVRVTGASITQGIQRTDNSVFMIKGRRTFIRAFVESTGPLDVQGVTAHLYANWPGGSGGPIEPINASKTITVRKKSNRNVLEDSFLFELPLEWTDKDQLVPRVEVNPYHHPLETDDTDNLWQGPGIVWQEYPGSRSRSSASATITARIGTSPAWSTTCWTLGAGST